MKQVMVAWIAFCVVAEVASASQKMTCPLGEGVRGWISMERPQPSARDAVAQRLDFVDFGIPLGKGVEPKDVTVDLKLLKGDPSKVKTDWKVDNGFLVVSATDAAEDGSHYLVDAAKSMVSFVSNSGGEMRDTRSSMVRDWPDDDWAGRPRRLAVVNAPVPVEDANLLSLRGAWDFCFRDYDFAARIHGFHTLAKWPLERKIDVPGCWEAQGVGKGTDKVVAYTHETKAKTGLRHYANGTGWYRKTVTLPKTWAGKRIWLKTGGVRGRGRFWVNDRPVARLDDYAGTWKYDVTDLVRPGEPVKVVAEASNFFPNRSSQGDTYNRWGGLWRDVEFEATSADCWIDDVWVRPDFDNRKALVEVAVEKLRSCEVEKLSVTVDGSTTGLSVSASQLLNSSTPQQLAIDLADFRPWSPEHPNLYTAKVELVSSNGRILQTRCERFGVRKIEVRGNQFFLNNRPFYVRGFGDDSVYPLTGLTPADRDFHRAHLANARKAGFNFVRLHTHAEIAEYFEAADEVGILIQPELSYLHDETQGFFPYDATRDAYQMHLAFRRHPSFAVYSFGNEGWLGENADRKLYSFVKALDGDRLVVNQDGGRDNTWGTADFRSGPMSVWLRGAYEPGAPFVAHEYLNLTVKCDPRDEKDFVGVCMPPATRLARERFLAERGLGPEWIDSLQDAQHELQKFWQKRGLEQARLDPFCDGYIYWTIVDFIGLPQDGVTCSANGYLDAFWRPKRNGWSLEEFATFNSGTVVLVDTTGRKTEPQALAWNRCLFDWPAEECYRYVDDIRRVYRSGETIPAEFHLAHYGETELRDAKLEWRVEELRSCEVEKVLGSGTIDIGDQKLGAVREVGRAEIVVPDLATAQKVALEFSVTGQSNNRTIKQSNNRVFWFFPKRPAKMVADIGCSPEFHAALSPRYRGLVSGCEAKTVIVRTDSPEEMEAMKCGKTVISLSNQTGPANNTLGWWFAEDQIGMALKESAFFRYLPREKYLTPLLFRIVRSPMALPVEGVSPEDIIAAGEGRDHCYLYLSESKTVSGGRHIRVSGLDVLTDTPEGTALLDGILDL